MLSSTRAIDLPSDAPLSGFVMRYGFQRGLVVTYKSCVTCWQRNGDVIAPPHEVEYRMRVQVIHVDAPNETARLIVHNNPVRSTGAFPGDPAPRRFVVYILQTMFGESIESTDPNGGTNLLLPRMGIRVGSRWREIETLSQPSVADSVEIIRNFRVDAIRGDQIQLSFEAEEAVWDLGPDIRQSRTGSGEFGFDATYGVLTHQTVRSRFTIAHEGGMSEIDLVHTMALTDA